MQNEHKSNGLHLPWLVVAGVFGLVISIVPFYGYIALAGRDEQWYFLIILGCWSLSCIMGPGMIILALTLLRKHRPQQFTALAFGVALLAVTIFAWGGLVEGFKELVAG